MIDSIVATMGRTLVMAIGKMMPLMCVFKNIQE
jgi:hypothetical protein